MPLLIAFLTHLMMFVSIILFLVLFLFYTIFIFHDFNDKFNDCVIPYKKTCLSPTPTFKNLTNIKLATSIRIFNPIHEMPKGKIYDILNTEISLIDLPLIIAFAICLIFSHFA